jgi:hypothetical protein
MQTHIDDFLIPTYQSLYRLLISAIKACLEPLGVCVTSGTSYMEPEETDAVLPAERFFTYISFTSKLLSADLIAKRVREEYGLVFAYG